MGPRSILNVASVKNVGYSKMMLVPQYIAWENLLTLKQNNNIEAPIIFYY